MKENKKSSQNLEEFAQDNEIWKQLEGFACLGTWELRAGQNNVQVSPGLCSLLGLSHCTELSLNELLGFYLSHEQERLQRSIQKSLQSGISFVEDFELITRSGQRLWVKTGGKPVFGADRKILKLVGYTQDFNETKLQLMRMEEERNLFKAAMDISKLGIWSSDENNNIKFDDRMREIYGFKDGEQESVETVQAKIHPDDRDRLNSLSRECAVKGQQTQFEYRVLAEKNIVRYIRGFLLPEYDAETKQFRRFIGINKDITDQVKGDETNTRHLEILDSTTDFISHCSIDKKINYVNRAFKELCGVGEESAHISSVHPKWANQLIQNEGIPSAIKNGTWTGETALLAVNGEEVPVSQVIICHYNSKKEPKYFSTIMRDMRETKKMLAALRKQKTELEEAARSKGNFLANMSHEIRTPMNGILGFVEILKQETSDEKTEEKLAVIQSSGELLLSIVDDILDFSNIEAGKLSLNAVEFDPMLVIQDVKKLFESDRIENDNNINLLDSGFSKGKFIGDPHRFKQLLFNLVSNACKFTNNGIVTIEVQSQILDDKTTKLKISVADTGIGIAGDRIDHLFKIFSQADESTTRRFGGIGLGLSICKSILDAWQGSITVESSLGKGSAFTFEIPLKNTSNSSPIQVKPTKGDWVFPGLKVLIAEDNAVNLRVAQKLLSKLEIDPKSVTDGEQAVEACKKEHFDIVLMDCHMPIKDGFEAAKEISQIAYENQKPPCIIALTAGVLEEEVKRCLGSGMSDVLFKPVNLSRLADMLSKHDPGFARPKKTVA